MSLSVAIARNTIVQTAGKMLSIAFGWATLLVLTNYLGAASFGSFTIISAYLQFFGVMADLGLVLVTAQLLAERPNERERVFANLLAFRLTTAAALLVLAPLLIWLFPYSPVVKQGVVILAVSFFLVALLQVFTGLFQKELAMARSLLAELAGRATLLTVALFAATQGRGVLFIVSGIVVSSAVNFGLATRLARPFVRLTLAYDPILWRLIWQRSWPIAAGVVLNLVYLKADTLILSLVRTEAEVGVYGAMYRVLEVLVTFPTMFAGLLLPVLSAAWVRQELEAFRTTAQHALNALLLAAVPLVVGVGFTAARLAALFGPDFATAGFVLWLLVLSAAIIFVGTFFGHLIVAVNRQRSMLWAYGLTAAVSLIGYLILIPLYGALAAASLTVAAELLVAVLAGAVLKRTVGISLKFNALGSALVAAGPMALLLWTAAALPLVLLILLAAVCYITILVLLGALPLAFIRRLVSIETI